MPKDNEGDIDAGIVGFEEIIKRTVESPESKDARLKKRTEKRKKQLEIKRAKTLRGSKNGKEKK